MNARIDRVAVVVPARNERELILNCLTSIAAAAQLLQSSQPQVTVQTVVVLDSCDDGSAGLLAAKRPDVTAISSSVGQVGAARRVGVDHALRSAGRPADRVWIACTDADSVVPAQWLTGQLAHAASGADLVLGTVIPDRDTLAENVYQSWLRFNPQYERHPYVHGANLGVRGDVYRRAGGFQAVAEHEDVLLTAAVRRVGGRVLSTAVDPVVTSGRTTGRTPSGLAGYLAALI